MEHFTHDGLTFGVRDVGPADGAVVVLLHGFPQDGRSWDAVVPALHAAGLRTLVPDQRGYSPGATPSGRGRYRLSDLVGDVVALLDQAGVLTAHVVGHDWGAGVAWELARRHPQRVHTLTALSVPHPAAMAWALRHSPQRRRSTYMAWFQLPFVERLLAPRITGALASTGLPAHMADAYGRRFADPADLTGPLNWYRALPLALLDGPGRRTPQRVTVPTTFVWGNRDPFIDRAAAERCGRYVAGGFRFVELDAGHWLPEVDADAVAAAVLARVGAA